MKELVKNKKLVIAICVAVVIVIGIAVWALAGGDGEIDLKESSPEVLSLMEKSKAAFENVSSVHSVMNVDMGMEVQDVEMDIAIQLGVYKNKNSDVQKTESVISLGGFGSQASTSYIDTKNNIVYTTEDGGSSWSQTEVSAEEAEAYVQTADFSQLLTGIKNYQEKGAETINGIAAVRYDGAVEGSMLKELMDQSGLFDSIGAGELTDEQKDEVGKKIGDMKLSVWIDPNTDLPQKLSIDMTNMMKAVLSIGDDTDSDEDSAADALNSVTMVYTNSEFDAVQEMEVPEEAKK